MEIKKHHHYAYYLIAGIILVLLLFNRQLLLTLLFLGISAVLQHITHSRFKIDLGHTFFFALLFARLEGVASGLAFVVIAGGLPKLAFGDIDESFFVSYPLQAIAVIASVFLAPFSLMVAGLILTFITFICIAMISIQFLDDELIEAAEEIGLPFLLNLGYFVSFSGLYGILAAI